MKTMKIRAARTGLALGFVVSAALVAILPAVLAFQLDFYLFSLLGLTADTGAHWMLAISAFQFALGFALANFYIPWARQVAGTVDQTGALTFSLRRFIGAVLISGILGGVAFAGFLIMLSTLFYMIFRAGGVIF